VALFAVKLHLFKEHVKTDDNSDGVIDIQKIESEKQLRDIFTKELVEAEFVPLRDQLMGWDLKKPKPDETDVHPMQQRHTAILLVQ
jgi:hypothetical protein